MTRGRRRRWPLEGLEMMVGCLGAWAMLYGLLPALGQGQLGLLLLGGAGLGAVLHLIATARWGLGVGRGLIEVIIVGAFTGAVVYGCMWYFTVYLAKQPNIMPFSTPPATPKK